MKFAVINWVSAIFCALLAAGVLTLCWFEYGSWEFIWLLALCAIISLPVCALLHELGHALFGLFSKIRAKISLSSLLSFFKPSSCEIIPRTDINVKNRLIATASGGLAVNALFVIFGIIAVAVAQIPAYLAIIAPASLYLLIINLLPFETGNGKTDGLLICELVKNEDCATVMLAVLTVQAQVLNGKPIAEVDEKLLFDMPQLPEDDPSFVILTDLRRQYCEAVGDTERAQFYARRFEEIKEYLN